MPKTEPKPVEQNPAEVPLYTPGDAARYLHVPLWAVFVLTGRFRWWPEPDLFFHFFRRGFPYPALLDDDLPFPPHPDGQGRITFHYFAELFVRAATFQVLVEWSRAGKLERDRRENLYYAIWRGLEETHQEPVPFGSPTEECLNKLAEPYSRRLGGGELSLLRKWFALRLERVEVGGGESARPKRAGKGRTRKGVAGVKGGIPVRVYPFSRDPAEGSPRTVVLDPRVRFGRPTVAGRGIPTDSLFERYQAGDSVAELAEDYDLTPEEVEEAIRYEALSPAPLFPVFGW